MGTELVQISEEERTKLINNSDKLQSNKWGLTFVVGYYGANVEDLGVVKRCISSDFVKGRQEGSWDIIIWNILTREAFEEGISKDSLEKLSLYSKRLRQEAEGQGLPGKIHIAFVAPEREQALINHLKRNNINYE